MSELDAEVLEELDAREMEDMLVGANVILAKDTYYSSDNDDDSYVGDYESKIGGNDSDKESNADDRNGSDRESITCSYMSFQSSGSHSKGHSHGRGCGGHKSSRGGRGQDHVIYKLTMLYYQTSYMDITEHSLHRQ